MPIPLIVDSIDAVPETLRDQYKEVDGKFRLDLDGYEDPSNLKSALQKEREAAKQAAKQVKAWESLGKSPEEIQELLQAQQQAEEDKLNKAGEWDKLKAQMNEQFSKEKQQLLDSLTAKERAIEKHLVDAQATAAIAELKGVPALLLPHVKASVRVVEEGGEYSVRVVDPSGNPRVNAQGEYLSIKDLVSEMRQSDIFGRAFEATGTTGSGTPSNKGGGSDKAKKAAEMTSAEKAKFIGDNGLDAWRKKLTAETS